ncbi:MAG TPA: methylmalonyl-CoA mutase family protein, partial [Candidatus Thermoplasmatota archaeon]|nr:methylmalonyl-CoA mutase family protein [Candidatus Thermoplasmatota archaeon]
IQEAAYRFQREVEEGERTVVGVNDFRVEGDAPADLLKLDDAAEKAQLRKLGEVKASRDASRVARALESLRSASRDPKENVLPHILEAVRAYATLGEVCGVLREEWGEYEAGAGL